MSKIIIVTGSAGLVGSETVKKFAQLGHQVVGIDNDMRSYFFGSEASTSWQVEQLREKIGRYSHYKADIRDIAALEEIFAAYCNDIKLIVHTAAQPSHDWAAREPVTDFSINATGTLNLLEQMKKHCPQATFIFCSTNKVYGDTPNRLPLVELNSRWSVDASHRFATGIDETMSIDQSMHSLFGASKAAADLLVQEYGRYFGLNTVCFRGGCLTGPNHSGAMLHGFLAYLMKCTCFGDEYTVFGYKGKQVRDNLHSHDLVEAFYQVYKAPRIGAVYNIGGGSYCNCSMLEAIELCEKISGKKLKWQYSDAPRAGDHTWYISDLSKFQSHYPEWEPKYTLVKLIEDIFRQNIERWHVN